MICLLMATMTCCTSSPSDSAPMLPFPHHQKYAVGVMPSVSQADRDAAVKKHYDSWKATYLVQGCHPGEYYVSTKEGGNGSHGGPVSESQGYGMNIIPLMAGYDADAHAEFDGLWRLVRRHRDQYGMMQWRLDGRTCRYADRDTPDNATDGDLDIGYGLILADRQWGGYTSDAKAWLDGVYHHDVAPDGHLKCEDDGPNTDARPSDMMLDHLRTFAAYDREHDWDKVVRRTEAVIDAFTSANSTDTGLLSDYVINADTAAPAPAPADYQENQPDNLVGYNSLRVPWHLGTDALLYGRNTAAISLSTASKESACLKAVSRSVPAEINPHLTLDCKPYGEDRAAETGAAAGPAAMAAGDQDWTNRIWQELADHRFGDGYYTDTIKMLVYLVMAGDYWIPGASGS
ncbi:glycosyl hydrolase family 8 [Streptomyces sp. NPDC016566]|uniref:glycosyl hydrolase family 8 n=1 Tax=Streptomyces sp. NPDC016566 TaxID=3364967 RepID=UPI0036F9B804